MSDGYLSFSGTSGRMSVTGLYPVFVPHLIFLDAHVWIKLTKYESDDLKYHFVNKKKQF